MRNPWPMFCVLAVTAALCISCPVYAVWLILLAAVVLLLVWIVVPMKYDDWIAKKINPYLLEYQQIHNLDKLESGLKQWQPWAITKVSRNMMQVNWFCALLEQERWEESQKVLAQIKQHAKTTIDWVNYHLLMAEYAKKIGDKQLAESESQLSDQLKTKMLTKKSNPKEPATAQQSKQAFSLWLLFVMFLMIGGGVCATLFPESILGELGAGAVTMSLFALPVAVVWLVVWLVRRQKEKSA